MNPSLKWLTALSGSLLFTLATAGSDVSTSIQAPSNADSPVRELDLSPVGFISETGLGVGDYDLIEGGEACQSGELRLIDAGDSVSLMLGAHALVPVISGTEIRTTERDCRSRFTSSFGPGKVAGIHRETCKLDGKDVEMEYTTEVTFDDAQLSYRRSVGPVGGHKTTVICKLKKVGL